MPLARLPLLLLALLLAGCVEGGLSLPASPPADAPTSPAPLAGDYPALPAGLPGGRVVKVVDGDTIDVRLAGREERVRMIGINTPESVDPRRPVQCFGREASANAKALLEGQEVLLEDDPSQDSRDVNGRLLRYVWLADGRMANLEQIVGGFAFEYTYDTPYRYRDVFRAAEREASQGARGLWAADTCAGQSIPAGEAPAATPAGQAAPVDPASCPEIADAAAPNAPVRIAAMDKRAEVVRLENVGAMPVSLDGWVLCSVRGGESQAGLGGALAPGEGRDFANPRNPIWSNSERDDAALFDASGRLVSYWEDR
jgi:micrococcal nuclease